MMVKLTSENVIAPALDIAVGKWFTPGIGLRVAYNGLQAKGAAPNANGSAMQTEDKYSNGYYKAESGTWHELPW